MICSAHPDGYQHGGRKVTELSVFKFCHRKEIVLLYSSETPILILLLEQELYS